MARNPETTTESAAPHKSGGLYSRVKVSVKTLDIIIVVLIAALVLCVVFMVSHNGFTVTYDTLGGTPVESVRVLHGETLSPETLPSARVARTSPWQCSWRCLRFATLVASSRPTSLWES